MLPSNRRWSGLFSPLLLLALVGCASGAPSGSAPPPEAMEAQEAPTAPAPSETAAPAVAAQDLDLWSRLQQPDTHYVVLMRHALAPGSGDPANFQLDDCSTQRNLSAQGRDQARRTGAAFRQRQIPVAQVLSSQWCRCLETAELLDLGPVEPFPPLNSFFQDRSTAPQQTAQVEAFIRQQRQTEGVTVMVTHFVNISALSGSGGASGEMVVMRVGDQEQLEVVGRLEAL